MNELFESQDQANFIMVEILTVVELGVEKRID